MRAVAVTLTGFCQTKLVLLRYKKRSPRSRWVDIATVKTDGSGRFTYPPIQMVPGLYDFEVRPKNKKSKSASATFCLPVREFLDEFLDITVTSSAVMNR